MKIAIYHNLEKGGALNSIIFILKYLKPKNKIDVYCFKENIPKNLVDNFYVYENRKTTNIFHNLFYILFQFKKINKKIAKNINKKKYDLVMVYPCLLTQSPYLLRFLKNKEKTIYFFTESNREFYEKTSFNYWSAKKILARFIRLPIKHIDKKNCQSAQNIICNSFFTSNNLFKNYGKKSKVIYPGLKQITPKKVIINNNKKILSVGQISKIKGHDFSINQLKCLSGNITILGRETKESNELYKLAIKNKVFLNIVTTEDDDIKNDLYKYYSIYLANNLNEPFGITTLEATSNNCFVIGKNEGGTQEIVKNGINGLLYSNIEEGRKILKEILSRDKIVFYQTNTIDWKYTSDRIIEFYNHFIKHDSEA